MLIVNNRVALKRGVLFSQKTDLVRLVTKKTGKWYVEGGFISVNCIASCCDKVKMDNDGTCLIIIHFINLLAINSLRLPCNFQLARRCKSNSCRHAYC